MSVFAALGGGNPFRKVKPPKWESTSESPSYKTFAGPHGQAFTAFRWARNIAITTTALSVCLLGSTIYFANQQARVETAVVVMDPYGRIENVVAASGFQPDERVKGHLVLKYIEAARSISSDRVRLRSDLGLVDYMTTAQGKAMLAKGYQEDAWGVPSMVSENRVRQVDKIEVDPPTSENASTFTAEWRERLWEGGRLVDEIEMRGTVVLKKPENAPRDIKSIKKNPTGLWVDAFKWSEN